MATTETKGNIQKNLVKDLLDIEYGLMQNKTLDEIIIKTKYQYVYNGFKSGNEAFCGNLPEECII